MALNETQLAVIIQGVRSICDELLDLSEAEPGAYVGDPALTPPPANPPANPPAIPPGMAVPPATPPGTAVPPADVDTEGITWDERIHTAKRSKLKSGVWRLKPGVDAVLVAKVKTELTLAAQAAAPANPPAAPPVTDPPAPPPAAAPPAMTWSDLLNKIVDAGKTPEEVLGACTACGVENIGKLQEKPELIPNVAMVLGIQ